MNTLLQKVTSQNIEVIKVLIGKDALALASDQSFQLQWDSLYTSCPWATVFQSRQFVYTWYKLYREAYVPLLVVAYKGDKLFGLLTLAQEASGQLIGAGANQAEYQVWLSTPQDATDFISKAFTELIGRYPQSVISLKFIPGNTPLQWFEADPNWGKKCFLRTVKQPLLILNKEKLSQELRKKNRKEKINRLKRQGELTFVKITERETFFSVLDELAVQSDFRKGAMYNKRVFQEDLFRKAFLKELFDEGLLHVTLLKVGENIIAANVGVTGQNWVHLQGINTHSPTHARYSPGILHFLMLGVMLAEEGTEVFDLTPGHDPYKDSLATDFTHATELMVGSQAAILNKKLHYKITSYLKHTLPKLGIEQHQIKQTSQRASVLKDKWGTLKKQGLSQLLKNAIRSLGRTDTLQQYILQHGMESTQHIAASISKDNLQDLLCYTSTASLTSKWEFLMDAMRRLETGQHAYTWQENGLLLGYAWLSEPKASRPATLSKMQLPAEVNVLHSFYCPSTDSTQTERFIKAVVSSVAATSNLPLYAIANSKDRAINSTLQSLHHSKNLKEFPINNP